MIEFGYDVEPSAATEVPIFADIWLGMNYDGASNQS